MAVNKDPIFTVKGDVSNNGTTGMNQLVLAAANDYTGIDADVSLIWTADATNGGYVKGIKFKAGGTNVATVARIYINNGSTPATATNNTFYGEVSLPATTAIATAATVEPYYPIEQAFPPGFRIYFGLATAVAAGWTGNVVGGQY
jgi:hypothetical protein